MELISFGHRLRDGKLLHRYYIKLLKHTSIWHSVYSLSIEFFLSKILSHLASYAYAFNSQFANSKRFVPGSKNTLKELVWFLKIHTSCSSAPINRSHLYNKVTSFDVMHHQSQFGNKRNLTCQRGL